MGIKQTQQAQNGTWIFGNHSEHPPQLYTLYNFTIMKF